MTQPLSGESSVLDTYFLISNEFLSISTKGMFTVEQDKRDSANSVLRYQLTQVRFKVSSTVRYRLLPLALAHEAAGAHQMRASRLVVRRRMVFCERSWLARMKRTVRLFARIKIECVTAVAPWERTPRKSALSLIPVAQKMMFFPFARSSAE